MEKKREYRSGYAALIGRPNVGKSTLLNALVSVKIAATSQSPQTTRNRITGVCHFEGGQIILLDTPGIHKAKSKLNQAMVKTAMSVFDDVDLVLFLVDAGRGVLEEDEYVLEILRKATTPAILVVNKIDLIPKPQILPLIADLQGRGIFQEVVPVSALRREGLDVLSGVILKRLPEGPPYFPEDMVTDNPERFLVGEIIREKTIRLTRLEVPYASAVAIDAVEEGKTPGVTVIHATLYVEKESQKKIMVGRGGSMIKKIGSLARTEIEKRLGGQVYLNLHVKVKANWRESDYYLKEFGYQ